MLHFISTALPWVIIGISVALIVANSGKSKNVASKKTKHYEVNSGHKDDYLSIGICVGMCCGVVLGTTGIISLEYGISFGMLIGVVVGMLIKKK